MSWVRGNNQNLFAVLRHLDRQTARRCGLAHAALSTDEDPLQRLLVDQVLEGGREFTLVNHISLVLYLSPLHAI